MNQFAIEFSEYIKDNKLMLKDLAITVGLNPGQLSCYHLGTVYPIKSTVEQINNALGTSFPHEVRLCCVCGADISDLCRKNKRCKLHQSSKEKYSKTFKAYKKPSKPKENVVPINTVANCTEKGIIYGQIVAKEYMAKQPTVKSEIERLKKEGLLK